MIGEWSTTSSVPCGCDDDSCTQDIDIEITGCLYDDSDGIYVEDLGLGAGRNDHLEYTPGAWEVDESDFEVCLIESFLEFAYCQGDIPPGLYLHTKNGSKIVVYDVCKVPFRCDWMVVTRKSGLSVPPPGLRLLSRDLFDERFCEGDKPLYERVVSKDPPEPGTFHAL